MAEIMVVNSTEVAVGTGHVEVKDVGVGVEVVVGVVVEVVEVGDGPVVLTMMNFVYLK